VAFLDLEPNLRLECVRAYNDFLVDFASVDPKRLLPLMWLPFWDIPASIAEMERCLGNGHHGIIMPSNFEPVSMPLLHDEHWYPIWDAAQSLDLSVNFHTGFQVSIEDARQVIGQGASRAAYAKGSTMFIMGNVRTITDLTLFGVCHRYPRLNFVSVEGGFGWLPYLAQLLDWQWAASGAKNAYPEMNMLPSEYIKRQVYCTFWFETIQPQTLEGFENNAMFSSDFPHPTSLSPGPASFAEKPDEAIRHTLAHLSDDARAKVLHDNAARIYHVS
jgi:predicted TIM-barrel fold metal-dependent hydrolase